MNIYDRANELARELRECEELKNFKVASEKIKSNEQAKRMLEDFRRIQIEAYTEQMQKGEISRELQDKLQNLGSVVSLNPEVANFLQAEAKFGIIWEDIMKILGDAIQVDLSIE